MKIGDKLSARALYANASTLIFVFNCYYNVNGKKEKNDNAYKSYLKPFIALAVLLQLCLPCCWIGR